MAINDTGLTLKTKYFQRPVLPSEPHRMLVKKKLAAGDQYPITEENFDKDKITSAPSFMPAEAEWTPPKRPILSGEPYRMLGLYMVGEGDYDGDKIPMAPNFTPDEAEWTPQMISTEIAASSNRGDPHVKLVSQLLLEALSDNT